MEKLNVIFILKPKDTRLTDEERAEFEGIPRSIIPEFRDFNDYTSKQAYFDDIDKLEEYKTKLLQYVNDIQITGLWDSGTGLQQGYTYDPDTQEVIRNKILNDEDQEIDEPIYYPFNITKYYNHISDATWAENGYGSKPIDEEEARNIQVNIFSGMPDRDLNEYN